MTAKMSEEDFAKFGVTYPAKFGRVGCARFDTDLGTFVFKRPDRRQTGIFLKAMADKDPFTACEFVALACVVSCPDGDGDTPRAKMQDILDTLPGLVIQFAPTFNLLCGNSASIEGEA